MLYTDSCLHDSVNMLRVVCDNSNNNNKYDCFLAHDELGMCRAILVSPEQSVLNIHISSCYALHGVVFA